MSSAGAVPIKTKPSTAAVGEAEAEIQAKQANVNDLKNIDIDSQHLNYEISSISRESWWKTEEKDVNNDLSHSMSVFPSDYGSWKFWPIGAGSLNLGRLGELWKTSNEFFEI